MPTAILQAPTGNSSYLTRLGNTYSSDEYGVIRDVPLGTEVQDLQSSGCTLVAPGRYPLLKLTADLKSLEDQRFDISLVGAARFFPDKVVAVHATGAAAGAAGGVYTKNEKGGDKLAALDLAALTGEDHNESVVAPIDPTLAAKLQSGGLYFTLDTVATSEDPVTVNLYIYGDLITV